MQLGALRLRRRGKIAVTALAVATAVGLTTMAAPAHAAAVPPPTTTQCLAATGFRCYGVSQIRTAYNLNGLIGRGLDGRGERIAVAGGGAALANDLAAFDAGFHLPPADVRIYNPFGTPPPSPPADPIAGFGNLDVTSSVEWAHAIAPGATLVFVRAACGDLSTPADFQCLDKSMRWLLDRHLVDVIETVGDGEAALGTQTVFGTRDWIEEAAAQHVPVISVAGDIGRLAGANPSLGPTPWWPAIDPLVTGVGTTELTLDDGGRRTAPDRVWNDSARSPLPIADGGGVSQFFDRPGYQHDLRDVVGTHRGGPDVAMAGGCDGRLISYSSFDAYDFYVSQQIEPAGWEPFCSSSQSGALFAGLVAIAQQAAGRHLGPLNPRLYKAADTFLDVTIGNNAIPATSFSPADPGNAATPGWDLVSGLGSPDAYRLVMALSKQND